MGNRLYVLNVLLRLEPIFRVLLHWRLRGSRARESPGFATLQCMCPKVFERRQLGCGAWTQGELPFPDSMRQFHAGEGNGRGTKGFKREHRCAAAFDGAMVLLNDVIEVPGLAYHNSLQIWILFSQ